MLEHHFPCHVPSKTVFIKHASVVDILCNHKSAIETWSLDTTPTCCCQGWHKFRSLAYHWLLTDLLPPDVAVLAEGSLQNKVFPQKREFLRILLAILNWCKFNGLPSIPKHQIQDLGTHTHTSHITNHITRSSIQHVEQLFQGAVFHCEDKHVGGLFSVPQFRHFGRFAQAAASFHARKWCPNVIMFFQEM